MVKEKFWVVWNPSARNPMVRHGTFQSAKAEARRLAGMDNGSAEFHVLELAGSARRVNVEWIDAERPF